ncbi:MAG: hypothetical protein QG656_2408 [Candidatus Hydrogenedentes bacterium]|nr:hypothetical protein [Candidatus Hydrogenedentota bacterium]
MNRYTFMLIVAVLVMGLVVGSVFFTVGPGRAIIMPKPPEVPKEAIVPHVAPIIVPYRNAVTQGHPIDDAAKAAVMDQLRTAMSLYGETVNGRSVLADQADDMRQLIREARRAGRWRLVNAGTDIFEVFGRSEFFKTFYREMAQDELARPDIVLKGFLDDGEKKDVYAFLEVHYRDSKKVENLQVREGEEFLEDPYTLKLIKIIGKNRGVTIEYYGIPGYTWDVMLN